jgi:hypothetical protein
MAALFGAATLLTHLVMALLIGASPSKSLAFASRMLFLATPAVSATAAAGTLLVFTLPQYFQLFLENGPLHRFGDRSYIGILLTLPVTSLLTWMSFNYIAMTVLPAILGDDEGTSATGISFGRYVMVLGAQAIVTSITLAYCRSRSRPAFRRVSAIVVVVLALGVGIIPGAGSGQGHGQVRIVPAPIRD